MNCLYAHLSFLFHSDQLEKLEVDPRVHRDVDFGNIVRKKPDAQSTTQTCAVSGSEGFVDDRDVPPLI